jgi:hypothetical protein
MTLPELDFIVAQARTGRGYMFSDTLSECDARDRS